MADSPFNDATNANTPLLPLSPERINANLLASDIKLQLSPTARLGSASKHSRASSDVQSMVARFNSLDIKDHAELRKRDAAKVRRAEMGREEAEGQLQQVRAELRESQGEVEELRSREMRVVKRLDVVMDDLHRQKEVNAKAQGLYEKEIRKARKEAFKASSVLVKIQEELKTARNRIEVMKSDLLLSQKKTEASQEEAFHARYETAGLQEKLARVEAERDALKNSLKEEEAVRLASEGRIALPTSNQEDEFASPRKPTTEQSHTPRRERNVQSQIVLEDLRSQLLAESRLRQTAEEMINFMQMECYFGCCSCRLADGTNEAPSHICQEFSSAQSQQQAQAEEHLDDERHSSTHSNGPIATTESRDEMDTSVEQTTVAAPSRSRSPQRPALEQKVIPGVEERVDIEQANQVSDEKSPPSQHTAAPHRPLNNVNAPPVRLSPTLSSSSQGSHESIERARRNRQHGSNASKMSSSDPSPSSEVYQGNHDRMYRTITTTTTVPVHPPTSSPQRRSLADAPSTPAPVTKVTGSSGADLDNAPKTPHRQEDEASDLSQRNDPFTPSVSLTREEAIAQLRERRGRARAATASSKNVKPTEAPKRAVSAGRRENGVVKGVPSQTQRREVSAPEMPQMRNVKKTHR